MLLQKHRTQKPLQNISKYMLKRGIHLAPSQFEAMFLSDSAYR